MIKKLPYAQAKEQKHISPDNTNDYFSSYDIGLVACLLCLKKYELVSLDKTHKNKVLFILKRNIGIDEDVRRYWDFNTLVDAQTFFNQIKRLKNQIYSSD